MLSVHKYQKVFVPQFLDRVCFTCVQYVRNSTTFYLVKMEYGPEINIFVQKMMAKSGVELFFLNSSMRKAFF